MKLNHNFYINQNYRNIKNNTMKILKTLYN